MEPTISWRTGIGGSNAGGARNVDATPIGCAAMATVRLHSDVLKPDLISRILGRQADVSGAIGEALRTTGTGKVVHAKTGTWYADTMGPLLSLDPGEHLRWAIDLVAPHFSDLTQLVPGLEIDFTVMVAGDAEHADELLKLSSDTLEPEIERGRSFGVVAIDVPSSGHRETFSRL